MDNLDILKEIEKKFEICKGKINAKEPKEVEAIISNIEKLIEQYKPENDIQGRIIQNRISEANNLKNVIKSIKGKSRKVKL